MEQSVECQTKWGKVRRREEDLLRVGVWMSSHARDADLQPSRTPIGNPLGQPYWTLHQLCPKDMG